MSGKRRARKRQIMVAKKETISEQGKEAEKEQTEEEQKTDFVPKTEEKGMGEMEQNLFLQYNDLEFSDKLMFEAAINDYCRNVGVLTESIEVVNLYVKPQEGRAYYVINKDGEKTGYIDL